MSDTRQVIVTGGAQGIGRAIVEHFVRAGDDVVAVGRRPERLEALVEELDDPAVRARVCDVTDEAAVIRLFEELGAVDVLVNNAGVSESAPLARTTVASWRHQLDVNALGAFLCTRAVLPGMRERGHGRVITVASTASHVGAAYTSAYTASKHAAVGLMRAVAAEVAGTGVTANAVSPAFVRTDMTSRSIERIVEMTGRSPEESERALAETSPLGRLLEPEEVVAAVAFLASAGAAAINGQTIVIDGGGIHA